MLLPSTRFVAWLDDQLVDFRFSQSERAASGAIVFVAIDKKSIDSVGIWPWPRTVHADLLDRLVAAGARDIYLDIDFSTPSDTRGDTRLAEALAEAGGGVILPVFKQHATAGDRQAVTVSRPISILEENSWLAFANVELDENGLIRQFPLFDILDGTELLSAAAMLANYRGETINALPIDFSINPATVPTYSVSDVLEGRVAQEKLAGRSVVVGAFATELGDFYAAPIYGVLSGPMLHVLATETLIQDRILNTLPVTFLALMFCGLAMVYVLRFHEKPLVPVVLGVTVTIALGEGLAFLLQRDFNLILPTALPWIVLLFGLLVLMVEKIDIGSFMAEIASAENRTIRRILRRVIADSVDAVIVVDHEFQVLDLSLTTTSMLGLKAPLRRGQSIADVAPVVLISALERAAMSYRANPSEVHTDYAAFTLATGDDAGFPRSLEAILTISPFGVDAAHSRSNRLDFLACITIRDMTARHAYEDKLTYLSQHDELTGLLNRRELAQRLEDLELPAAIFAINLHRFGVLNSTLGREVGDRLLKAVGELLKTQVAPDAMVGRIGGDVFAVIMPGAFEEADLGAKAEEILGLFDVPIALGASRVDITARIGAAPGVPGKGCGGKWLADAELALDEAKTVSGRGWRLFDPLAADRQERSRRLEGELRRGLDDKQFFLLYQPQVDLKTGDVIGAEALLRWQHPSLGVVSPGEFIAIAEANGFICELGRWMLVEACRTALSWPQSMSVAINVSPLQFVKDDLVTDVRQALLLTGLPAERLHLEITESSFLDRTDDLLKSLDELRMMGVTIALDDFGTGYSSLAYLAGFPIDKIKIDQSFVRKMLIDTASQAIVVAVAALARGLDLKIVCEGIEGDMEWTLLRQIGCEEGQGYFFGKPQTSEQLLALASAPHWSQSRLAS